MIDKMNALEKWLKMLLPFTAVASISSTSNAQMPDDPSYIGDVDPAARLGVLGVNVGLNGLICGIVAAVEERREIFKDIGQCMGGGMMQYAGMEIGMNNIPVLPGIGLRAVETGTSIIDNTLAGREMFEHLYYEFGPALFRIDTKNKGFDFYWRVAPVIGLLYNYTENNELNWLDSFSYQTFVFNSHAPVTPAEPQTGLAIGNIMMYNTEYPGTKAHEFNHVLQYARFRPAQLLVPEKLSILEDTFHYRLGEDAVSLMFWGVEEIGCITAGNQYCSRRWWNLLEAESYTMETGYGQYKP